MIKNKIFFFLIILSITYNAEASLKKNIITKLQDTTSLVFDFNQTIDNKINEGSCQLLYPKKILCEYRDRYNKIIISDGKKLILKNKSIDQVYSYDLNKTPLKIILDKEFLIEKIKFSNINTLENNKSSLYIKEDNLIFEIFFNSENYNILGWKTIDIYQNTIYFEIYNLKLNTILSDKIFDTN